MTDISQIRKVPLPATVEDMLARKPIGLQNLNDHVDAIHVKLFATNERYQLMLDAVHDGEAQEGSLAADNLMAAMAIRDYAKGAGSDPYVANKKLAIIVRALNVCLRRYRMTRQERAVTLGGEVVPSAE